MNEKPFPASTTTQDPQNPPLETSPWKPISNPASRDEGKVGQHPTNDTIVPPTMSANIDPPLVMDIYGQLGVRPDDSDFPRDRVESREGQPQQQEEEEESSGGSLDESYPDKPILLLSTGQDGQGVGEAEPVSDLEMELQVRSRLPDNVNKKQAHGPMVYTSYKTSDLNGGAKPSLVERPGTVKPFRHTIPVDKINLDKLPDESFRTVGNDDDSVVMVLNLTDQAVGMERLVEATTFVKDSENAFRVNLPADEKVIGVNETLTMPTVSNQSWNLVTLAPAKSNSGVGRPIRPRPKLDEGEGMLVQSGKILVIFKIWVETTFLG